MLINFANPNWDIFLDYTCHDVSLSGIKAEYGVSRERGSQVVKKVKRTIWKIIPPSIFLYLSQNFPESSLKILITTGS